MILEEEGEDEEYEKRRFQYNVGEYRHTNLFRRALSLFSLSVTYDWFTPIDKFNRFEQIVHSAEAVKINFVRWREFLILP